MSHFIKRGIVTYYKDREGCHRWNARSGGNHKITADSAEGYGKLSDAKWGAFITCLALLFGRRVYK